MSEDVIGRVDDEHQGTPERRWRAWPALASSATLELPTPARAVIVAPHPDDEVLGAGGLIQRLSALGWAVSVLAVTDGEGSHRASTLVTPEELRVRRTTESVLALARLGCSDVPRLRLGIPDGAVNEHEQEVVEALQLAPGDLCVAPWRKDGHPDHDACGRAASRAAPAAGAMLAEYLVWTWHWASPEDAVVPWSTARRVSLDRREVARKRYATLAYRSQIRGSGDEPAVLPAGMLRRAWRPFEVFLT